MQRTVGDEGTCCSTLVSFFSDYKRNQSLKAFFGSNHYLLQKDLNGNFFTQNDGILDTARFADLKQSLYIVLYKDAPHILPTKELTKIKKNINAIAGIVFTKGAFIGFTTLPRSFSNDPISEINTTYAMALHIIFQITTWKIFDHRKRNHHIYQMAPKNSELHCAYTKTPSARFLPHNPHMNPQKKPHEQIETKEISSEESNMNISSDELKGLFQPCEEESSLAGFHSNNPYSLGLIKPEAFLSLVKENNTAKRETNLVEPNRQDQRNPFARRPSL